MHCKRRPSRIIGKKSRSQSSNFLHILENHGFHILFKKLDQIFEAFNEIDNSLSFGAKQNVLGQIFLELRFFRDFFTENSY